jgi:branched-chain amino acid transport system substrate-binding protein
MRQLVRTLAFALTLLVIPSQIADADNSAPTSGTTSVPQEVPTTLYLAYQGILTGNYSEYGKGQLNAVKFAISKFNLSQTSTRVELIPVDDLGDMAYAPTVAQRIAANSAILGVVGPQFSGTTITSLPFYRAGGLALISPSASRASLTNPISPQFGGPIFHRIYATDSQHAQATAKWATDGNDAAKVFIIDDQSTDSKSSARDLREKDISKIPGASLVGSDSITQAIADFSPTIAKIKASGADVVIFTGGYIQASQFIQQLRTSGSNVVFACGEAVNGRMFLSLAGIAAEGTRLTSSDPFLSDISPTLALEYFNLTGVQSDENSVQAINATNVFLSGISEGVRTRAEMLTFVKSKKGVRTSVTGKDIFFKDNGEIIDPDISYFTVLNGKLQYINYVTKNLNETASPETIPQEPTSKQEVEAKANAEKIIEDAKIEAARIIQDAKTKVSVPKKTTITCIKGKVAKKVTAISPKCPAGYKKK